MSNTNLKQKADFSNKNIYVGMDVHKKTWTFSVFYNQELLRRISQPASCEQISTFLKKEYPNADYLCGYESGFCGFSVQREMETLGLKCFVLHAADIPQTSKGKVHKNDKNDSKKIAQSLSSGMYNSVYVPSPEDESDRGLVRFRYSIQKDLTRSKNRIKGFLLCNGIDIPIQYENSWSKNFIEWLKTYQGLYESQRVQLDLMIDELENIRKIYLKANKSLRVLQEGLKYQKLMKLLVSIPGIGPLIAITLITEIMDISRFCNVRKLYSYVGLIPTEYSSGEQERKGHMTKRQNLNLRYLIIEAAWKAVKLDPALTLVYEDWTKKMMKTRAIIKIARKLTNRIHYVWTNETLYENGIIK